MFLFSKLHAYYSTGIEQGIFWTVAQGTMDGDHEQQMLFVNICHIHHDTERFVTAIAVLINVCHAVIEWNNHNNTVTGRIV